VKAIIRLAKDWFFPFGPSDRTHIPEKDFNLFLPENDKNISAARRLFAVDVFAFGQFVWRKRTIKSDGISPAHGKFPFFS
jgi:hypothetical protein